jgi:hypothetical protein
MLPFTPTNYMRFFPSDITTNKLAHMPSEDSWKLKIKKPEM